MGLDMYAHRTKGVINKPVDFSIQNLNTEDLHYWRKHPNLHGWMEQLYYDKGGQSDTFNCVNVELDMDDLENLLEVIENDELPQTGGFFFGATDGSEKEGDLQFVKEAMKSIEDGYRVYYTSWW